MATHQENWIERFGEVFHKLKTTQPKYFNSVVEYVDHLLAEARKEERERFTQLITDFKEMHEPAYELEDKYVVDELNELLTKLNQNE